MKNIKRWGHSKPTIVPTGEKGEEAEKNHITPGNKLRGKRGKLGTLVAGNVN